MCGILGSVNFFFDQQVLDLIQHRGPDHGQIDSIDIQESRLLLGHRRLSIVDLSEAAHQPMHTTEGNYSIIFNGEIYNHQELRENLKQVSFRTHSDTETILYHLMQNGIDGVKDFNGVFAFCFVDKIRQKLYLARDPFGVKPLYYYHHENRFIFSSEIRPIKECIKPKFHDKALPELLKLRYNPAPDTLYKDIYKIRPGHILEYDLVTHQVDFKVFIKPIPSRKNISLNQAIHRYGDLFEQAVKRQLMADVEVGMLLSGGIDSALVAYYAVKNSAGPIKSFTVGFQDEDASNELQEARESAEILKTQHHEVVISQDNFEQAWEKVVKIVEEPLGTTSSIPMYYLNQEVARHVKVVLTGQGADEPLGGYNRYKGEIYRKKLPRFIFEAAKPLLPFVKNEKLRRFIYSAGESDVIKRFEKTYAILTDQEIKKLTGLEDYTSYKKIKYFYDLANGKSVKDLEAMMSIDTRLNLADDLLLYTDKISMHFAVETRVPILDLELVEFIESLPLQYRINGTKGKFIHKEFAKNVLPDTIINRSKKGFMSPTNKWFSQSLGAIIQSLANDKNHTFASWFDLKEIERILNLHKSGINQEKQLFLILSIYFWFKNANL